jgi:hypothetical protein
MMNRKVRRSIESAAVITAIVLAGGLSKTIRYDYVDRIGYWGGVVAAAMAVGVIAVGVGQLFGLSWPRKVLLAGLVPIGVLSFEEISKAVEPSVGKFPSDAIGALVALVICWALSSLAATCCGIRWNQTANIESTTKTV